MARVHERVARKDYPAQGIAKGDKYFTWKTRVTVGKTYQSTVHRSKTRPATTSQSEFAGQLAGIQEALAACEDSDAMRSVAEEVRDLGAECQEKFENMPEGLQQGDTGQMLEERASNCESWADEIEQAAEALDEKLGEIDKTFSPENVEAWAAVHAHVNGGDVPEPFEEDPTDLDEDSERREAVNEAVSEAESACPF